MLMLTAGSKVSWRNIIYQKHRKETTHYPQQPMDFMSQSRDMPRHMISSTEICYSLISTSVSWQPRNASCVMNWQTVNTPFRHSDVLRTFQINSLPYSSGEKFQKEMLSEGLRVAETQQTSSVATTPSKTPVIFNITAASEGICLSAAVSSLQKHTTTTRRSRRRWQNGPSLLWLPASGRPVAHEAIKPVTQPQHMPLQNTWSAPDFSGFARLSSVHPG